jgi:hypothetical protein
MAASIPRSHLVPDLEYLAECHDDAGTQHQLIPYD